MPRRFHGETEVDTMTAVLREEPAITNLEQAAIPAGYQDIVRHCLEKEPEKNLLSDRERSHFCSYHRRLSPALRRAECFRPSQRFIPTVRFRGYSLRFWRYQRRCWR